MAPARARFLLSALADLAQSLGRLGLKLELDSGCALTCLEERLASGQYEELVLHRESGIEEQKLEEAVASLGRQQGVKVRLFEGETLVDPLALPFELTKLPQVFTEFRRSAERAQAMAEPLPEPKPVGEPIQGDLRLPALADFGLQEPGRDPVTDWHAEGGETAGWSRLRTYFWDRDCLKQYKITRNGMLGEDYSSKFSPWLAAGCLSPRSIYAEIKRYERERVSNDSTYWLGFELLWRDFFQLLSRQQGAKLFRRSGICGLNLEWSQDRSAFDRWAEGKTGFPIIDANMRELNATGFMSNRGRQIVASFLTKNLGIDWRWGAAFFESQLIDFDPASNYGNWQYVAGVGNDPREFRYFDVISQAKKYDPKGEYVKHWIPALRHLGGFSAHEPPALDDYPTRMVDFRESIAVARDRHRVAARQLPIRRQKAVRPRYKR